MSSGKRILNQIIREETGMGMPDWRSSIFFTQLPNLDPKTMSKRIFVEATKEPSQGLHLLQEASTADLRLIVDQIQGTIGPSGLRALFEPAGPLDPADVNLWSVDIIDDAYGDMECIKTLKTEIGTGTLGETSEKIVNRIRAMVKAESKVGQNRLGYWTWVSLYWQLKTGASLTAINKDNPPPGGPAPVSLDEKKVLIYWNSQIQNPLDLGDGTQVGNSSYAMTTIENLLAVVEASASRSIRGSAPTNPVELSGTEGPAAAAVGLNGPLGSTIWLGDEDNLQSVQIDLINGYISPTSLTDIATGIYATLDAAGSDNATGNQYIATNELVNVQRMLDALVPSSGDVLQVMDPTTSTAENAIWKILNSWPGGSGSDLIGRVQSITGGSVGWNPLSWGNMVTNYKDGIDDVKREIIRIFNRHKAPTAQTKGSQILAETAFYDWVLSESQITRIRKPQEKNENSTTRLIREAVSSAMRPVVKSNARILNESISINMGPLVRNMEAPDLCIYEDEPDPTPPTPPTTPPVTGGGGGGGGGPGTTGGRGATPVPATINAGCPNPGGWTDVTSGAKKGYVTHDAAIPANLAMSVAQYIVGAGRTDAMTIPSTIQVEIRGGKVRRVYESRGNALRGGLFRNIAAGIRRQVKRIVKGTDLDNVVAGTISVTVCPNPTDPGL